MQVTATVTRNPRLLLTLGASVAGTAMPLSYLDTDGTMAANSDVRVPSQKAVRTYVANNGGGGSGDVVGPAGATDDLPAIFDGTTGKLIKSKTYSAFKTLLALVKGDVGLSSVTNDAQLKAADLDTDGTMAANSATKVPAQSAVVTYVAAAIAAVRNGVSAAFDTLAEIATELALKAYIASPAFTGVPTAPTAAVATNTTQLATTAFVIANAGGGTFATLDNETLARVNLAILR